MLTRADNWTTILAGQIELAKNRPFSFGSVDCCLFAADVVHAITGIDPAVDYRGTYKTKDDARRVIEIGGGLLHMTTRALGAPVDWRLAQRADVVLIDQDGAQSLGICLGMDIAATAPSGLIFLPMECAKCAWHY